MTTACSLCTLIAPLREQLFFESEEPRSVAVVVATQISVRERCYFVPLAQYSAFRQQLQQEREDARVRNESIINAGVAASAHAATAAEYLASTTATMQQIKAEQAAADAAKAVSKTVVWPLYAEWLPAITAAGFACGGAVLAADADFETRTHELTTHTMLGAC
jgi:hypothetical protein